MGAERELLRDSSGSRACQHAAPQPQESVRERPLRRLERQSSRVRDSRSLRLPAVRATHGGFRLLSCWSQRSQEQARLPEALTGCAQADAHHGPGNESARLMAKIGRHADARFVERPGSAPGSVWRASYIRAKASCSASPRHWLWISKPHFPSSGAPRFGGVVELVRGSRLASDACGLRPCRCPG